MRKYILLIATLFQFVVNYAQDNKTEIEIIEKEIELALAESKYDKAAELDKEKKIYLKIAYAVEKKNYEKAAALQKELMMFGTYRSRKEQQLVAELKSARKRGDVDKQKEIESELAKLVMYKNPELVSDNKSVKKSSRIKSGFFIDAMFGLGKSSIGGGPGGLQLDGASVDLRLGNRFYFGNNSRYRVGIQAVWLKAGSFSTSEIVRIQASPLNVGLTNILAITDNMAVELAGTGGLSSVFSDDGQEYGVGHTVGGELKFRYKKIDIGIDYSYYDYFLEGEKRDWRTDESDPLSSWTDWRTGETTYYPKADDRSRYLHKFSVSFGVRF